MINKPKVQVLMLTFNHERYIAQAIEGVMMQQTNFEYELIIADDCSTDRTREICLKYKSTFAQKITLLLNEKNLGPSENTKKILNFSNAEYIALCEGDDYWSSPYKLQKQIDFLDANIDFTISFHAAYILEEGKENRVSNRALVGDVFTVEDLAGGNFLHTPTVVYRNAFNSQFPTWYYTMPIGDYPLHMLHASRGKIKFFAEPLGFYRIHGGGAWSGLKQREARIKWINVLEILIEGDFNLETKKILIVQKRKYLNELLEIDLNSSPENFENDLLNFSEKDETFITAWKKKQSERKGIHGLVLRIKNRIKRL